MLRFPQPHPTSSSVVPQDPKPNAVHASSFLQGLRRRFPMHECSLSGGYLVGWRDQSLRSIEQL